VARRLVTAVVLAFAAGIFGGMAGAEENEAPILGDEEALTMVVLGASAFCPEPPAHLPVVDFRLELRDLQGRVDPMLLEILASEELLLELTMFRGGFEQGKSESFVLEPFGGGAAISSLSGTEGLATSMTVGDLAPGVVHYARVLFLVGGEWAPTETIRFTSPICAVDGLDREGVAP